MTRIAVGLASIVLAAGCTSTSEPEPITAAERTAVMTALANDVYAPAYRSLAEETQILAAVVDGLCSDTGTIEEVRAAWSSATDAWLATSAFRFGPVRTLRLGNTIAYPIDKDKVDEAATLVTIPEDVGELGSDARGLLAIEQVLTKNEPHTACPYLQGAADQVSSAAATLAELWDQSGGYAAELSSEIGSQDGIEMAVNGLRAAIDDLVFFRLQDGLEVQSALQADRATTDARLITESIRLVYLGVQGTGIGSLVAAASGDAHTRTETLITDLQQEVTALLPDAPDAGDAAHGIAIELRNTLATEITSLLSATLMLGDADGDA